jgi:uncharacterized membrane protein
MSRKQVMWAYLTAFGVFLVLDGIWLSTMTDVLYRPVLGGWMRAQPDWVAAALFYLLYIAGLVFFAVAPALHHGGAMQAAGRGALLALVAYGEYDLTNQATLSGWPWSLTLIDVSWGMTVSALGAALAWRVTHQRA